MPRLKVWPSHPALERGNRLRESGVQRPSKTGRGGVRVDRQPSCSAGGELPGACRALGLVADATPSFPRTVTHPACPLGGQPDVPRTRPGTCSPTLRSRDARHLSRKGQVRVPQLTFYSSRTVRDDRTRPPPSKLNFHVATCSERPVTIYTLSLSQL